LGDFFPAPATTNFKGVCFLATDLTDTGQQLEATEQIKVFKVPFERAVEMVWNNEIRDVWAQMTILRVNNHLAGEN